VGVCGVHGWVSGCMHMCGKGGVLSESADIIQYTDQHRYIKHLIGAVIMADSV
jgi:hypothetical protein